MKSRLFFLTLSLFFYFSDSSTRADEMNFDDLSLEQLMNVKVSVASRQATDLKQSPAVVTVITSDEIEKSGARDLIDVLSLVPGFNFGSDTQGVVGLAFRGLWSQEGKILFLIDNFELTENLYNNLEFGNHYPVSIIKRIEIIRGPGSVIYGGNAEMAVIKITTKTGADLKGAEAVGIYGRTQTRESRSGVGVNLGNHDTHSDWSMNAYLGQAIRTDRNFTDSTGQMISLQDASNLDPEFINLKYKNDALGDLQIMIDHYHMMDQTAFGQIISQPIQENFFTIGANYKKTFSLTPDFKITSFLSYKRDEPWQATDPILSTEAQASGEAFDASITRLKTSFVSEYHWNDDFSLIAGFEALSDQSRDHLLFVTQQYENYAVFSELTSNLRFASLSLGARYDWSPDYGHAFSPRIALVKQIEQTHFKLLYNKAFRTPSIEDIDFATPGAPLMPEHVTSYEFEVGHELNSDWFASINLFRIQMDSPIIYNYANGQNIYFNGDSTGTYGLESEVKTKKSWGHATLNYSYYHADATTIPSYAVQGNSDTHLGIANHKVTAQSSLFLLAGWTANPSLIWLGDCFGYAYDSSQQSMMLRKYTPSLIGNLFFEKHDLLPHLTLGLGIYNLLNEDTPFIQPYNTPGSQAGHPPIPSLSREYAIRVKYEAKF